MNPLKHIPAPYLVAAGAVAVALLWLTLRGAKGLGQDIGAGAVDLVDGVVSGGVVGTGKLVGVPETNMTECDKAIAAGNTWAASFACPAKTFIKSIFN